MDSIQIKYLKQVKTISAVMVLVSFCLKAERDKALSFEYAMSAIAEDSNISKNTVRRAIEELEELNFIRTESTGKGSTTATYRLLIEMPSMGPQEVGGHTVEPPKVEPLEWQKTVAARKKRDSQEQEIALNILKIDFNNINLLRDDINSLSILNTNLYMNDKELGQLANRVMKEVFLPMTSGTKPSYWFPAQMKIMKDLLVQWRTEQVVAAIRYWTEINPPANGITSLKYLLFERKGTSNFMHGLDYYKQQYLANVGELEREKNELKVAEILRKEAEEAARKEEERKAVASMSNDDFIRQLLGG